MSRRLLILSLFAIPGALAACDSPKVLSKAKPGECYAVVGRDSLGAAKLAKTACPGSPAAIAAVCPPPPAASTAACAAPGLPEAVRGEVPAQASPVVRSSYRTHGTRAVRQPVVRHRVARHHSGRALSGYSTETQDYDNRVARSGEVTSLGLEYARVDEALLGGPQDYQDQRFEGRRHGYRQERGGARNEFEGRQGQRYERRDYESHQGYAPPPPPPPPVDYRHREAAQIEHSQRQSQVRAYRSESSSSSSSSSSSGGGYQEAHCDCDGPGHGASSPTPFDQRGFLTWRGKTPGY